MGYYANRDAGTIGHQQESVQERIKLLIGQTSPETLQYAPKLNAGHSTPLSLLKNPDKHLQKRSQ